MVHRVDAEERIERGITKRQRARGSARTVPRTWSAKFAYVL